MAHPATMTHASMSDEARRLAGIGTGLLRLSVGIEDRRNLGDDLRAGLARAAVPAHSPSGAGSGWPGTAMVESAGLGG